MFVQGVDFRCTACSCFVTWFSSVIFFSWRWRCPLFKLWLYRKDPFMLSSVFFCIISDILESKMRFSRSMVANRSEWHERRENVSLVCVPHAVCTRHSRPTPPPPSLPLVLYLCQSAGFVLLPSIICSRFKFLFKCL